MWFVKQTSKLFFLILAAPLLAWGLSPSADFDQRARAIADQLRCPVCRGVPISESPSPLAMDMVQTIRQKLKEGQTEEQILSYFENHYGEWILLEPKPKGLNRLLWICRPFCWRGAGFFWRSKSDVGPHDLPLLIH